MHPCPQSISGKTQPLPVELETDTDDDADSIDDDSLDELATLEDTDRC